MRIGTMGLAGAALLLAASAASAGGHQAATPDASGVIAGRQSAMLLSGALMGSIKGAIDRGDEVKGQAFAARSLTAWAKAIPGMFPAGSGTGDTEALPTVWSDRAGFEAKAAAYAAAASKLADAAKANDKAAFAAAFTEVRGTCGACHDSYKKPDAPH
jgi:cytochrome c556